jgi:hypothetical protein
MDVVISGNNCGPMAFQQKAERHVVSGPPVSRQYSLHTGTNDTREGAAWRARK